MDLKNGSGMDLIMEMFGSRNRDDDATGNRRLRDDGDASRWHLLYGAV